MGCWQQAAENGEGRVIGIPALFRSRMAAGRGGIPLFGRRTAAQSRTHRELFAVWHGRRRGADRISVPSVRERLRQRGSATRQECQKGRGRGSEKLLPSLPTPLPSLLSLCCASDCPFFLPRQIPTASSSCSFCIMSSFRSQASRYPHHRHHRPNFASKKPPTPTSPPPPLGELLQTIDVDHLDEPSKDFSHSATISNVRTVASYSWVDKKGLDSESTILIPGAFPPPPQESLTHLADS